MISVEQLYEIYKKYSIIATDTRKLPKDCIFFALKGDNFNGNKFAQNALAEGAAFVVVDEEIQSEDTRILRVENVLTALQNLATFHRNTLGIPVLAITGSNGKTTTKELVAAVLSQTFKTLYTQGNLNNHIGVPLTLLSINDSHEFAVIEMGANHQKEIELLCSIAKPDFGMITNIGKAHLEGFGGIEGVKKGKGELYQFLKNKNSLIFINSDSTDLSELADGYTTVVTYGKSKDAHFIGSSSIENEFLTIELTSPYLLKIQSKITGEYNFNNVMAAIAIGSHFGVPTDKIKAGIEGYIPTNQRSQIIDIGELKIVMDAYNANPSSMEVAIANFKSNFLGDKFIALGEMLELGEVSRMEHLKIGELIQEVKCKEVVLVGKLFAEAASKFGYRHFDDSMQAATYFSNKKINQGVLLIKGSRGSKMENILAVLK
jgi:UDP-N-acetylmuramoyl-tripeptide--D-alanyl-D-alanine ligase